MDCRERHLKEKRSGRELSLDRMQENGGLPGYVGSEDVSDVVDIVLQNEEQAVHKKLVATALGLLSEEEKQLIQTLFFDEISAREYARKIGVSDMAIRKRRNRILKKIKSFFEK